MIKKWFSILLIFSIGLTVAEFTLPYLWYYSNYEYVATELCIHQHRTDHNCNGMCQLKLMLHKQHKHHGHSEQIIKSEQRIDLFTSDYFTFLTHLHTSFATATPGAYFGSLWFSETDVPPPKLA